MPKDHRVLLVTQVWLVTQDTRETRDHKGQRGTREIQALMEKGVHLVIQELLVLMANLVKLDC